MSSCKMFRRAPRALGARGLVRASPSLGLVPSRRRAETETVFFSRGVKSPMMTQAPFSRIQRALRPYITNADPRARAVDRSMRRVSRVAIDRRRVGRGARARRRDRNLRAEGPLDGSLVAITRANRVSRARDRPRRVARDARERCP